AHHVVGELALVFHVAEGAGRRGLALLDRLRERRMPVPGVAAGLVVHAVARVHVGLELVVVDAVVAGRAGLGLARLDRRELVTSVAVVALLLVGMAHRAAFGDLALLHGRPRRGLDVGLVVQRVRRPSGGPLVLWPGQRVALGLALRVLAQVAGPAGCHVRQLPVLDVMAFRRPATPVAADAPDLL